jgi:hypothetical protein
MSSATNPKSENTGSPAPDAGLLRWGLPRHVRIEGLGFTDNCRFIGLLKKTFSNPLFSPKERLRMSRIYRRWKGNKFGWSIKKDRRS